MRVSFDDGRRCALEFGSLTSPSGPNGMYIGALARPGDRPTINHIAFGIPNFWTRKAAIKTELERRGIRVRPDGEAGWTFEEPAHFMTPGMQVTPEKDEAMYPGADVPCAVAASERCKLGWQAGQRLIPADPKPSGKGFKAAAYSHIVFDVRDVRKERDFYVDLWGMNVLSEKYAGADSECLLGFGQNTLDIRQTSNAPRCNQYGFVIEDFDPAVVEAELRRRSLDPHPDPKWPFAIKDPDGFVVGIAAKP